MNPRSPDRPALPIAALYQIFRAAGVVPGAAALEPSRLAGELSRVRAREQARLLAEASELALGTTLEGRLFAGALASPRRVGDWTRRCAVEIDQALGDDAGVDGELIACCLLAVRDWPPAEVLAGSACRLDNSPVQRLALARTHFAAGRYELADALLASLERARLPLQRRAQLREAQGLAAERAGDPRGALWHFECSAALGAGARASLAALCAAVELGLEDRASWALEAIELVEPDPARLSALLREVIERRALLGRPVSAGVAGRVACAILRERGDLTRELCR